MKTMLRVCDRTPRADTLDKIKGALEFNGVIFSECGVERRAITVTTYNDYMDVLADIEASTEPCEILFHCADDARSSEGVIAKLSALKKKGYTFRSTICEGNTTLIESADCYRWLPEDYFAGSEISVIYGNKFMQHVPSNIDHLFIVMSSSAHCDVMRNQFEYWWRTGRRVEV